MFLKFTDSTILEELQTVIYIKQLFSSGIQYKPTGL